MFRTLTSRFAVTSLLTLTGCLSLHAQAQAPSATQIAFSVPNNYTVLQSSNPIIPIKANISDPNGIQTSSLSSTIAGGSGNFNGSTYGSVTLYFFAGYYPKGDYTFTATVHNCKSVTTSKSVTVHVM